jgi:hypothetical protein
MRKAALGGLLLVVSCGTVEAPPVTGGDPDGDGARDPAPDLADRLAAIEGMTAVVELSAPAGHRLFSLR